MKKLQNLPIGKSSFESIRENNDLYVDKTGYIFRLASEGEYYFLSRPRRFGKSLTVSTLRCLFQGRKELFEGLWISDHGDWEWKKHPVILIDFNGISHDTPENLKLSLTEHILKISALNDVQLMSSLLKGQFKELILSLYQKTGMPVVILIDEYDKPIIDHLGKGGKSLETAKTNRDGYRFSEKDIRVYNPFSVLKSLNEMAFKNYWFETGTPTFLVNLLKEQNWYLPKIEDMKATEALFSVYEIERLQPEALLFQTGYVTIDDIDEELYSFRYPNQEVRTAFLEFLFHSYTQGLREGSKFKLLSKYLRLEYLNSFIETMRSIFKSIPYTQEIQRDEAYFHTIFYLMVSASGATAHSEVLTCDGRIDLVIEFPDKVFVIEFKCDQSADAATRQIRDKSYDLKYRQTGKKIFLMGISFDSEKRNISEWKTDS